MFYFILGFIVICIPYIAVFLYPNPIEGFLKIFSYSAIFFIAVSIITQALHIFTFPLVLSLHIIFALFWLALIIYKKRLFSLRPLKNNWIFFVALAIIFIQLFLVHFSYTGTVQAFRGAEQVSQSSYTYPLFSDEWVTSSLANYSIQNNALPIVNPLYANVPFPNIIFTFSSVLAEIFLITGLNPVTQYCFLAIFFGVIISASIYTILKVYDVNKYIASATMLFVPYIANSGNIPGLWSLIPCTIGTIFLLWQIISQKQGNSIYALIYAVLALIIYPPIVVFVAPVLVVGLIRIRKDKFVKNILYFLVPFGLSVIVFAFIYLIVFTRFNLTIIGVLSKYIVRPNLDLGIPSFVIWNILPLFVLLLAAVGIYVAIKNKYHDLVTFLAFGFFFWFVYAYINKVFFIEYPRVVVLTSLMLVVSAGIGFQKLIESMVNMYDRQMSPDKVFAFLGIITIFVCLCLVPFYTSRKPWEKLTLVINNGSGNRQVFTSAPAVNRYLTTDDLKLFQSIKEKKFIAPPWKGLVIGVVTHNFPLETKPSTITNQYFLYSDFMNLDCQEKVLAAQKNGINYVYSDSFSCPQFKEIGSSKEELYLYKI